MIERKILRLVGVLLIQTGVFFLYCVTAASAQDSAASTKDAKDIVVTSVIGPYQLVPWISATSTKQFTDPSILQSVDAIVACDLMATRKLIAGVYDENGPDEIPALFGTGVTDEILLAIQQGNMYGTVTTQPYAYGYRAIEVLALREIDPTAMSRGRGRYANRSIIGNSANEDVRQLAEIRRGRGPKISMNPKLEQTDIVVDLLLQSDSQWWDLVEAGCRTAAEQFSVELNVKRMKREKIRELESLRPIDVVRTTVIGVNRDNDLILSLHRFEANGARPVDAEVLQIRCDFKRNGLALAKMVQSVFPKGAKIALIGHSNAKTTNHDVLDGFQRQLAKPLANKN